VTAVLATAPPARTRPLSRGAKPVLAILPWVLVVAAFVAGLLHTGTPARDVAIYAVYLAAGVVLPGTLIYRAFRGSRGNLPEDLGVGAATGLPVQLAGWALAVATGLQSYLILWPVLVVLPFLAVKRLRRHWRIADRRPLPARWSWSMAGAMLLVLALCYPFWRSNPLPPAAAAYYQDLLYHLSLVYEMTRSMPFQVPQLTGDTLRYHYLSNADMAAGSLITGISPAVLLFRLWIGPIIVISIMVVAVLAREVTGRWWAGPLAGACGVMGAPLVLGAASPFGGVPITTLSPSQAYAFPLLGLLLLLMIDVLRGRPMRWTWPAVFPLALAAAGAKSSALPPVVAGVVLATVAVLIVDRARLRPMLAFLGLTVAALLAGLKIFAGGGAGTLAVQPLATLFWFTPYRQTLGADIRLNGSGFELPGLAGASTKSLIFVAGLVLWWLLMQAPRLAGLAKLGGRQGRRDPVVWLLAGVTLAGTGGILLFWHPAASQIYFFATVVPFAVVLSVWLLVEHPRPMVAGLLAGAVWVLVVPEPQPPRPATERDWLWALFWPVFLTAAVAALAIAVALVAWRIRTGRFPWRAVPVALVAAALAGGMTIQLENLARIDAKAITKPAPAPVSSRLIEWSESAAALWLNYHAGRDDVVATNVHCNPIDWKAACDARAFWVAGLAGRRTLVESWAYTDQALAADGQNGKRFSLQPAPYPERFALNQRVFARADPADVAELRSKYHVRWLFADSRATGGVSPQLAKVATVRYQGGPVTIYELG
jgi:hypothetical protein